jgi:uncharacterized repeat protein (TIGR04042 family)
MPETHFHVRWPDGGIQRCYPPSTVIEGYSASALEYEFAALLERNRTTLLIARERVQDRYGPFCPGAADQPAQIDYAATHGPVIDTRFVDTSPNRAHEETR